MAGQESGAVVWVRLGQVWWPGVVTPFDQCPADFKDGLRKEPLAVVKFFEEQEFQDVHKAEQIFSYNCERKEELIRKGQIANRNKSRGNIDLLQKFEADVTTAENLTGGDGEQLLARLATETGSNKRRIDYSDLGFGQVKAKKKKDDTRESKHGTDIGQICLYKGTTKGRLGAHGIARVVEYKCRIMEQPRPETMETDMVAGSSTNFFKCHDCGFTCGRVNVMVWHNKWHLGKVANYDSGIKVPGRRRRKRGNRGGGRGGKRGGGAAVSPAVNGLVNGLSDADTTQRILEDWNEDDINGYSSDEEEQGEDNGTTPRERTARTRQEGQTNVGSGSRAPPPKPADMNSAFDLLLAATPVAGNGTTRTRQEEAYACNDSDDSSDSSDWEKYYTKDGESEGEGERRGESDIRSLCEGEGINGNGKEENGVEDDKENSREANTIQDPETDSMEEPTTSTSQLSPVISSQEFTEESVSEVVVPPDSSVALSPSFDGGAIPDSTTGTVPPSRKGGMDLLSEAISSIYGDTPPSTSPVGGIDHNPPAEPAASSGDAPSYMLVAMDSQGNAVPMPTLREGFEGGADLVAVEAVEPDGTTRTLYIDKAQLGPDVDLGSLSLMLQVEPAGAKGGHSDKFVHLENDFEGFVNSVNHSSVSFDGSREVTLNGFRDSEKQNKMANELVNEEEFPDLSIASTSTSFQFPYKVDDFVWTKHGSKWWPSYIRHVYQKEKKVSVYFVNFKQSTGVRKTLANIQHLSCSDWTSYTRSDRNVLNAYIQVTYYQELVTKGVTLTPLEFFSMSCSDRLSLIDEMLPLKSVSENDMESTPRKRRKQAKFYELVEVMDEPNMPSSSNEMSPRENSKLQQALELRRKDNVKFVKFIGSSACMVTLRKIRSGETPCKRHTLFINEETRSSLKLMTFGPFQNSDDPQLDLIIEHLNKEILKDAPEDIFATDYAFFVWLPEAIKEAYRVVKKVPVEHLEKALRQGYGENRTERLVRQRIYGNDEELSSLLAIQD